MKKGFKLLFLGTMSACLSLTMLPQLCFYSAKAETISTEEIGSNSDLKTELPNMDSKSIETEEKEAKQAEEEEQKAEVAKKQAEEEKKAAEVAKKQAEEEKKKAEENKNAYNIKMTAEDRANLYRLVQSEVGYMDEKSKLFVASVVLNRVKHKSFPNTVTGVVMAHNPRTGVYQFSPVKPGGRFWNCEASKETKKAVDKVLKNGDYSKGAVAFVAKKYTTAKAAAWFDNNLRHLFHHNGQDYYKYR
ncbi:MAG: cell wall hydrolase [Catonella sp.]|uniref:cell wall hydrolase n=1 Tax=Catonella sp. TaxID=2382125 RepID=UPI003FA14E0B